MNLRKGFFRLTLVLSVLVGIVSSFPVLEHSIENKRGIVYGCLPYGLQIRIDNELKARKLESLAKEMGSPREFMEWSKLHSKAHTYFGPDYILFWWRHLAVLSLPGFVAVWVIYGFIGWVIIPFIVRGFQGSPAKGGETE